MNVETVGKIHDWCFQIVLWSGVMLSLGGIAGSFLFLAQEGLGSLIMGLVFSSTLGFAIPLVPFHIFFYRILPRLWDEWNQWLWDHQPTE